MADSKRKVKGVPVQKQHLIFMLMITVGVFLLIMSQLSDMRLLINGIAFIIVGCVGMISWTPFDIGDSIREVMREIKAENQKILTKISESNDRIAQSQDNIAKLSERVSSNQKDTT